MTTEPTVPLTDRREFQHIHFNEAIARIYADAVKRGNPKAIARPTAVLFPGRLRTAERLEPDVHLRDGCGGRRAAKLNRLLA